MRFQAIRRRSVHLLLTAVLLAQLTALAAGVRPAQAATSADPAEEIVYVDGSGVIRVLDTQGDPLVQWFSPTGGWGWIALGDVNDDGDQEILAAARDNGNVKIAVFDPVVAAGATSPDKKINGIPWDTLFETTFPGETQYIYSGNYDDGVPGDEFIILYKVGTRTHADIWNAASLGSNGKPSGRDWKRHIQKDFEEQYEFATSGQVIEGGTEEILMFDRESLLTQFGVFRPDQDMERVDGKRSDNDVYRMAAIGPIRAGGDDETAVITTASRPDKPSLIVYETNSDNELQTEDSWAFAPQPEHVFLADISGNGDKEVFFLRKYPEGKEGARLIMRDDWGDDRDRHPEIELALMDNGANNEFRRGAGGDTDGDGKDEVIILRDNRIRIFTNPDRNVGNSSWTDYANLSTDRDNLVVGDLDKNGFIQGPVFAADKTKIEATVPAGTISGEFTFSISNISTSEPVQVNALLPAGLSWATVNPSINTINPGQPAVFRVRFDARNAIPGEYATQITLTSPQPVLNQPFLVTIQLTVLTPKIQAEPGGLAMYLVPCEVTDCTPEEEVEATGLMTRTIRLGGSNDLVYQAAVVAMPDDVGAAAASTAANQITGGAIDDQGNLVIYDAQGNTHIVGGEVSASAVLSNSWTIDPVLDWVVSASSDKNMVPSTVTLVFDPTKLAVNDRKRAVLVLVADTRAGGPPDNVVVVPLELNKVSSVQRMPLLP